MYAVRVTPSLTCMIYGCTGYSGRRLIIDYYDEIERRIRSISFTPQWFIISYPCVWFHHITPLSIISHKGSPTLARQQLNNVQSMLPYLF